MTSRIEDYALIGDTQSAALVGRDGAIDWACFPRFDSGACFAALLGDRDNGRWLIAPRESPRATRRRYRPDSLVLETEMSTATGTVRLIDFMPIRGERPDIVRIVEGIAGTVDMHVDLVVRFDMGRATPWVRKRGDALVMTAGPDALCLRGDVEVHGEELATVGDFTIHAGERRSMILTWFPSHQELPPAGDPSASLPETEEWWRAWSARCKYEGPWREAVVTSLRVLKALTYGPTGGIVAAPTTSLPEWPGGERNWDYRYCWLRDATLTLLGAMHAGYYEEAQAWREWLLRAVAGSADQIQIMYGIGGERRLSEWEADWLSGYEKSVPVRIGNAAHTQLQLDVFGEIMDTYYQARRGGLAANEFGWDVQLMFLEHLTKIWRTPDQGIWEIRGPPQQFTYSKVMVWVAYDRAIKSVETFGLEGPLDDWRKLRDVIFEEVCECGFNQKLGTFVQAYGSDQLDANLLQLPCVGFLPADDPRIERTVAAIEQHLMRDGFVMRYSTDDVEDALPPGEGAFLACSFWLVDVYILQGRFDEAETLFRRLVGLCNDVGLLSEEYDPKLKRLVGNFPQAFSHLALVNSAYNLTRARKPVHQRAHDEHAPSEAVSEPAE